MDIGFDRYYTYDVMTRILGDFAETHPNLCRLYSIGTTPENRELWLLEITNFGYGDSRSKPGFYIDGNTHAGEVVGSAACLYTIHRLLNDYSSDVKTRFLVDNLVFYICPRVSPDGAELYLTSSWDLRCVPRPYPKTERQPGLHPEDVDNDGWITLMRIADPNGDWKVSEKDSRLMIRCGEDGDSCTRFKLLPEGRVYGPVDGSLQVAPPYWGLDFNRNFPCNWQPEHMQQGSGPYALSEPETRATADFILAHPNIAMIKCYHSHGHGMFRPPSSRPSSDFSSFDIDLVYRVLGAKYVELTGGPVLQSYDEKKGIPRIGSLMDWAYQHLGIIGWVPELWAWGKDYDGDGVISEADCLRWNDEELNGTGFVDWHVFDHPQLGEVEIGGWKTKYTMQNPPGRFLEPEIQCHYAFTTYLASCLPRVVVSDLTIQSIGSSIFRVDASVSNVGLLPTNLTDQAIRTGRAQPVGVSIITEDLEVIQGPKTQTVGHLSGAISGLRTGNPALEPFMCYHPYVYFVDQQPTSSQARVWWTVRGRSGRVAVRAVSEKGGTAERSLSTP